MGTLNIYVKKDRNLTEPTPTGTHEMYARKGMNLTEHVPSGTHAMYAKKGMTNNLFCEKVWFQPLNRRLPISM